MFHWLAAEFFSMVDLGYLWLSRRPWKRNQISSLGCPSKTCFLENKKAQPIPVVSGGWLKGSQKDFWFWQTLGRAQTCQKSHPYCQKKSKIIQNHHSIFLFVVNLVKCCSRIQKICSSRKKSHPVEPVAASSLTHKKFHQTQMLSLTNFTKIHHWNWNKLSNLVNRAVEKPFWPTGSIVWHERGQVQRDQGNFALKMFLLI